MSEMGANRLATYQLLLCFYTQVHLAKCFLFNSGGFLDPFEQLVFEIFLLASDFLNIHQKWLGSRFDKKIFAI